RILHAHTTASQRTDETMSVAADLFVELLLDRHVCQRAAIVAFVTADPPLLNPFFLDVGLPALRADEDALDVMDLPLLFHNQLPYVPLTSPLPMTRCIPRSNGFPER